jgi:hypothetical protein
VTSRLAVLLMAGVLAGCSGIQTYPNSPEKNVTIRTETKSGSIFSSVQAAVHVHAANPKCATEYKGTVQLTEPVMRIGIPADWQSYLVFSFANSSLLGSSSSTTRYDTLLRPRAGYTYDINVSYVDDFYSVAIREIHLSRSFSRDVPRLSLKACAAQPG